MPLVRIEIVKGKSADYKKKLMEAIHNGLVSALHIDDDDRYQRLYEIENALFERSPLKTDKFTMIEITMFQGRTKEQKHQVIKEITRQLFNELEIEPSDVFIVMNDPNDENWGLGGKQRGF